MAYDASGFARCIWLHASHHRMALLGCKLARVRGPGRAMPGRTQLSQRRRLVICLAIYGADCALLHPLAVSQHCCPFLRPRLQRPWCPNFSPQAQPPREHGT